VNQIVVTIAGAIEEQNITMQDNVVNINQASQGMTDVFSIFNNLELL